MSDVIGTLTGLVVAMVVAIVALVWRKREQGADDRRIAELIKGNRARPRPGMDRPDGRERA